MKASSIAFYGLRDETWGIKGSLRLKVLITKVFITKIYRSRFNVTNFRAVNIVHLKLSKQAVMLGAMEKHGNEEKGGNRVEEISLSIFIVAFSVGKHPAKYGHIEIYGAFLSHPLYVLFWKSWIL